MDDPLGRLKKYTIDIHKSEEDAMRQSESQRIREVQMFEPIVQTFAELHKRGVRTVDYESIPRPDAGVTQYQYHYHNGLHGGFYRIHLSVSLRESTSQPFRHRVVNWGAYPREMEDRRFSSADELIEHALRELAKHWKQ